MVAHQQYVSAQYFALENMFSQEEVILSGLSGAPMMIRGRVSQDILRVILCSADPTNPTNPANQLHILLTLIPGQNAQVYLYCCIILSSAKEDQNCQLCQVILCI